MAVMRVLYELVNSFDESALLLLAATAVFGSYFVGQIVDRIMRQRGFGPTGNAILILAGIGAGLMISYQQLGPLRPSEANSVIAATAASSTLVLLVCGALKSFLLDVG